jgi:hypothetical protein
MKMMLEMRKSKQHTFEGPAFAKLMEKVKPYVDEEEEEEEEAQAQASGSHQDP